MPEKSIQIDVDLDSQDLREGHALYAVLNSAIKGRTDLRGRSDKSSQAFWTAGHFHLDKVSIFRECGDSQQQAIVKACGRNILAESYYIEKCGMYFSAKMSLLAKTTQERMLYSIFASDEAAHFNWITSFISPDAVRDYVQNPFIKLLDELLQKEDRATLAYLVQVILEGWGIHHYHQLAKDCIDADLKKVFESILKDEARHHASGLILFNEQKLTDAKINNIVDLLLRFFPMVQAGPQMVVSQIEQIKGRLSRAQKTQIFEELGCESETAKKLAILKSLIKGAQYAGEIVGRLEQANSFNPFNATQCAIVDGDKR
jgi:rubrerythrin